MAPELSFAAQQPSASFLQRPLSLPLGGVEFRVFGARTNGAADLQVGLRKAEFFEDENRRLKQIVAEQTLDIQALKAVVANKW